MQENDMADQMAQKFGVTSANSISSGATNGALPRSGLHESLSKFLDKAGAGLIAWLMQSTIASANAEKKQALANEMIDDRIHQVHAKKQQQALKAVKDMATITNHNVPVEMVTLPTAMDPVDVDVDDMH